MKVTVRTPCFNHSEYVEKTLDSVLNQTVGGFQWIVSDDGSTDDSRQIIAEWFRVHDQELQEKAIACQLLLRADNRGLCATLNEQLPYVTGDIIMGIASDDIMLPDRVETTVDAFQACPDSVLVVHGRGIVIDRDGETIAEDFHRFLGMDGDLEYDDLFDQLTKRNFILAPTTAVRTSVVRAIGGYREDLKYEDWYLWLKLSRMGSFSFIDRPLIYYRYYDGNSTKVIAARSRLNAEQELLACLTDHLDRESARARCAKLAFKLYQNGITDSPAFQTWVRHGGVASPWSRWSRLACRLGVSFSAYCRLRKYGLTALGRG